MSQLHTLIQGPTSAGLIDWFPAEEVHIFPLHAPLQRPHHRAPEPADDPTDPFGPENFSPRWWPGQDPTP